jgi:sugar phosphate isomerase/epimerase
MAGGGGVRLGLLTACLPDQPLEEIAAFAADVGYEALEIAAWPALDNRPFTATHIAVDPLIGSEVDRVRKCLDSTGLSVSSLAYYGNNLHPDPAERHATNEHVLRCIDAAVTLGCPTVGTFIGRDPGRCVADNLRAAEAIFPALADYAGERAVKIVIENCVMEGWHPDGYPGNLAYSPELWEWMFSLGLYLNFDPSHLLWLGIDPIAAVQPYIDRVAHAQAKDIELFAERRNRYGFFGKATREDPWDTGWWRYRVPGLGDVAWRPLIDSLCEGGFDGTISVEHEDPVWSGDLERVQDGLRIAYRTLRPLLVAGCAAERTKETPDA